jgi:hypothetical protein
VFVGDEVLLAVTFTVARAGLADLARRGLLLSVSEDAYSGGISGVTRIGPPGSAPDPSRLVRVRFVDLTGRNDSAGLALRWEAIGPGGGLVPVLDADITLSPSGKQATLLTLAGVYRPPPGSPGAGPDHAILHRVAAATIRSFINGVAAGITVTGHAATAESGTAGPGPAWLPPAPEVS